MISWWEETEDSAVAKGVDVRTSQAISRPLPMVLMTSDATLSHEGEELANAS